MADTHYTVRVRITTALHGSIDGIHLDRFLPGSVYEVSIPVACYLLAEHAAEPAPDDEPVRVLPPHQRLFGPDRRKRGRLTTDGAGRGKPDR